MTSLGTLVSMQISGLSPAIDAWPCELPARRPLGYAIAGECRFSTGWTPTDLRVPAVHGSIHRMPR